MFVRIKMASKIDYDPRIIEYLQSYCLKAVGTGYAHSHIS